MEINATGNACGYCAWTEKALGRFWCGHFKGTRLLGIRKSSWEDNFNINLEETEWW